MLMYFVHSLRQAQVKPCLKTQSKTHLFCNYHYRAMQTSGLLANT